MSPSSESALIVSFKFCRLVFAKSPPIFPNAIITVKITSISSSFSKSLTFFDLMTNCYKKIHIFVDNFDVYLHISKKQNSK